MKDIQTKLAQLAKNWDELKSLSAARAARLDENLAYQQFLATVEEEESWIIEKQHLLCMSTIVSPALQIATSLFKIACDPLLKLN